MLLEMNQSGNEFVKRLNEYSIVALRSWAIENNQQQIRAHNVAHVAFFLNNFSATPGLIFDRWNSLGRPGRFSEDSFLKILEKDFSAALRFAGSDLLQAVEYRDFAAMRSTIHARSANGKS